MALNPGPIGKSIADYLYENPLGAAGTPVSKINMETLWQGVMTLIYADLQAHLGLQPGTFEVTVPSGGGTVPVTGIGGPAV